MPRRLALAAAVLALALAACGDPTAPTASPGASLQCAGGHTQGSGTCVKP